ncbi:MULTISPECIES: DUF4288 domain-containing protein [unclassified Pseudonocardia]|uniref:DUF4288 domain-containing protein n=1 Tax=unclassified Pseudonocardia TaxID=2619320 RepID=UPI0001FFE0BF|nr:DUF4288 domain-containing protein [Pseudonocardia sp. Ae707_Ps1]OLM19413.1 hypothetical protein Ae707Ps1_3672c [Pseudonocardia sp. Ae707_Ps1]
MIAGPGLPLATGARTTATAAGSRCKEVALRIARRRDDGDEHVPFTIPGCASGIDLKRVGSLRGDDADMAPDALFVVVLLFDSTSSAPSYRPLYREDVLMLRAPSLDGAQRLAERHGHDAETTFTNHAGETVSDRLVRVVDVAPALSDDFTTTVVDVYSRHFRDIAAYRRFDPLCDGEQL